MDGRGRRVVWYYEVAAAIVWVALLIASAVILRGTPNFNLMLTILGGGAVFFLVLLPGALSRMM